MELRHGRAAIAAGSLSRLARTPSPRWGEGVLPCRDCNPCLPKSSVSIRGEQTRTSASRRHLVLPQRPGARNVAPAHGLLRFLERQELDLATSRERVRL